jgi:hypothetical protein
VCVQSAQSDAATLQPGFVRDEFKKPPQIVNYVKAQKGIRVSIYCGWQNATFAFAAALLMTHDIKHCFLLQVGLFVVPPTTLPSHWGFAPGSLPPLGASPGVCTFNDIIFDGGLFG